VNDHGNRNSRTECPIIEPSVQIAYEVDSKLSPYAADISPVKSKATDSGEEAMLENKEAICRESIRY
jgi:hypothetical protein